MPDYDVVVIGAGLGGLSAAALLAKEGLRVLVCEHTERVGGCCSSFEHEGFTFDIGASIVEMAWIIDELFKRLGLRTADYIDLLPIDPIYGFVTDKGERFAYPVDREATREVVARLSTEDARAWDRFAAVGSEAINEVFGSVMCTPMQSMLDALKIGLRNPKFLKYARYLVQSFESTLCGFFKDDRVRASMSMQSYYIGLPPALCPGYAAFLAYSEHEGIFYPRGGMVSIPEGIARAFREFGGEIRFDSTVRKVLLEGKKAVGVELADGATIRSRLVLSNVNAKVLYLEMVGRENLPGWARRAVESYEVSIPCPMIMLGLDEAPELQAHHTICYGTMKEMNDAYFEYFLKGRMPDGGMMIICWPTHADPSLAPEGKHVLNIVTLAPYRLAEGDWDSMKERYLETMLDSVERRFHVQLREHIVTARVSSPLDFERALLHPQGAVYGLNNDLFSTAMFRPGLRSRVIEGLYLAGASTHFGGGVPTTIGSGVAVSGLIQRDLG